MVSGICIIKYIEQDDILFFPFEDIPASLVPDQINLADIKLKPGKNWLEWNIMKNTSSYKQDEKEKRGNEYFRQRIKFKIAKAGSIKKGDFYNNCCHVVIATDKNGISHLIGSRKNPAQISYSMSIDKGVKDESIYEMAYFRDCNHPSVLINNVE